MWICNGAQLSLFCVFQFLYRLKELCKSSLLCLETFLYIVSFSALFCNFVIYSCSFCTFCTLCSWFSHPASIKWFIDDQVFSPSSDLAPSPPLPSANFLSFSVFPCSAGRVRGGEGRGGEEPNHMNGRKSGPLQIIEYSLPPPIPAHLSMSLIYSLEAAYHPHPFPLLFNLLFKGTWSRDGLDFVEMHNWTGLRQVFIFFRWSFSMWKLI
jgi:hypothetical protein